MSPRVYTRDEIRDHFIRHVVTIVRYWENEDRCAGPRDRLEGLAFSLLCMLDGVSSGVPAFVVAPSPNESDEEFLRNEGENWYPRVESEHDIAGDLHDRLHALLGRGPHAPYAAGLREAARRFLNACATLPDRDDKPLKNGRRWKLWTDEADAAFDRLNRALREASP